LCYRLAGWKPALRELVALAQNGGQHSGIAAGVGHRNYKERFFLRRIADQEITDWREPERLGCQLFTSKTYLRKVNQLINRFPELIQNRVGRVEIVGGDEFPYFLNVAGGCGMEDKTAHLRRRSLLLRRNDLKTSSPGNGYCPGLDLVVAGIQCGSHFDEFREVASHGIFDQFGGFAAGCCGELLKAGSVSGLSLTTMTGG
jgi:hypothetical protein